MLDPREADHEVAWWPGAGGRPSEAPRAADPPTGPSCPRRGGEGAGLDGRGGAIGAQALPRSGRGKVWACSSQRCPMDSRPRHAAGMGISWANNPAGVVMGPGRVRRRRPGSYQAGVLVIRSGPQRGHRDSEHRQGPWHGAPKGRLRHRLPEGPGPPFPGGWVQPNGLAALARVQPHCPVGRA